ncbi:MAG: SDR family NAD(P)-dependent oxidoreductase [Acidobacteriota bacterium]
MSLENRVVLITGAKGGLGTYVTNAFLAAGATVAGVSRSIQQSDFGHPSFTAIPAELSSRDAADTLAAEATARFGRIDAVVHLLGGFAGGTTVADSDDATLEQMFDLNFRSLFHITRAVLPGMRTRRAGSLLAVGSRTAVEPKAGLGLYSASKAALVSLMGTVAKENACCGISANVVLPGTMDTPANRKAMPDADTSKWVQPSQIAALLVHLASCQATQLSGAVIPVYGGEV